MRKVTSLLFSVLLFGLFMSAGLAQAQIQIGNGTTVGKALPVEPYFGYTYSQVIYLASEISASGDITTLSWDFAGSSLSNSNDWTIYMGHTTKSEFASTTDWIDVTTLTEVYSGEFTDPGAAGWIEFDITDFAYNGVDNLVIAVDENKASYNSNTDDFNCSVVSANRGLVYRSDGTNPNPLEPPVASYNYPNIANIILGGIQQLCPTPTAPYVENITTTTADLGWTVNGEESLWDVIYGEAGFDPADAGTLIAGVTENPYTLTGLSASSAYDVYVRADCGTDEVSGWAGPVNFATVCVPFNVPVTENFDAVTEPEMAICWLGIVDNTTSIYALVETSDTQANSEPNSARIYNSSADTANLILVSPEIVEPLSGLRVTFYAYGGTDQNLIVGTMADPMDPASFTPFETLLVPTDFALYSVSFAGYAGSDQYVAFKHGQDATYDSFYIDDITIEAMPSCLEPSDLMVNMATTTTAELGWTPGADETTWDVIYGDPGFDPEDAGTLIQGVTDNPYTITGLSAASTYDVFVRADCGTDETSAWAGPLTFQTACEAFAVPVVENFDGVVEPELPICWVGIVDNTTNTFAAVESSDTQANSPLNSAKIYNSSADTANLILVSPEIVEPLSGLRVTFYAYGGVDQNLIVGTMADPMDPASFTPFETVSVPSGFAFYSVSFAGYAGSDQYVAFQHGLDDTYDTFYVDDITIEVLPSCLEPVDLMVNMTTTTTAEFGWTPGAEETTWDVIYGEPGFDPADAGTLIEGVTDNPYTITGLEEATAYDAYVRADCGNDDVSDWSGPVSFSTMCEALTIFPWTETFEDDSESRICWSQIYEVGNSDWTFAAGSSGGTITSAYNGTLNARYVSVSGDFSPITKLVTPMLDLSAMAVPGLTFYLGQEDWFGDQNETKVYYRVSPADAWVEILHVTENLAEWTEFTVLLPNPSATYQIAFEGINNYGRANVIDDVTVQDLPIGTLDGTVTEATRGPVQNAHIMAGEYEAYTDETGYYMIEGMIEGMYDVVCEADAYFPLTVEGVEIIGSLVTTQDFELGFAQISVTPESLTETLLPDATSTQILTISNPAGTGPLEWSGNLEELEPPAKQHVSIPAAKRISGATQAELSLNRAPSVNATPTKGSDFDVFRGSNAFAFDMYPGQDYVNFDTDVPGTYTLSVPVANTVFAADFDQNNVYYAVDSDLSELFTVDLESGVFTSVAPTLAVTDMAFDYTTNTMYAVNYDGVSNTQLYTMDLVTGATTLVGDCGAGLIISMACDGFGDLYGFDIITDEIVYIDKATAAVTVLGSAGFDGNYAQGMAWDPASDIIYMSAYNLTSNQGELRVVDITTGATSLVGALPGEICGLGFMGTGIPWISIDPVSGVVNPGESQDVTVTFDATGLIDSTYLANININHNGQEVTDGTVVVPAALTVASSTPPEMPTNLMPEDGTEFVALQPVFSWTNGAGTAQSRMVITKGAGPFTQTIYSSGWFVGEMIDLAAEEETLLTKTTYGWTVSAKNAAGQVSTEKISFTTIGAGTISGLVTDSYTGSPLEGVTITADGIRYEATTGTDGTYEIPDVIEGDYMVTAELEGYVSQTQEVSVVHNQLTLANFDLDLYLDPPFGLQANVEDFVDVQLTWNAPGGEFTPEWLTYSGEVITNSIGTDAAIEFDVAARYEPDQLTGYSGGSITKMQFVPGEPDATCTYTLKVWQGTQPPTLVYEQVLPSIVADEWNEVTLDSPVPFDNTEELWFGFGVNTTGGFPAGCDAGPEVEGYGNMILWSGEWTTLTQLGATLTYNWAVKAYVEAAKGAGTLEPIIGNSVAVQNNGTLGERPEKMSPAAVSNTRAARELLSFNVYKNGEFLLNTPDTAYMDSGLESGKYEYAVTAIYDEGESDPTPVATASILPPPVITDATPGYYGVDVMWAEGSKNASSIGDAHELTSNIGYEILRQKKMGTYKPADPINLRCTVECPPEAIAEGEACLVDEDVDVTNGGCNSETPVFTPIQNGDVICGTASTYLVDGLGQRDTDWYELVITEPKTISWTIEAEFPAAGFIIDGNDGCEGLAIIASATVDSCEVLALEATVPPGTYWLFAGPSVFEGFPCGENNTYVASLTTTDAFLPYYNVYRDDVLLAPGIYDMEYYDDEVVNGETYCYAVSQVVNEAGLETPQSADSCVTVPLIPEAGVTPDALTETHIIPPAQITMQTVTITNSGLGTLDWDMAIVDESATSIEYCDASTTSEYEYISNVLIGDIDNPSGYQSGVADYTYLSTQIEAGQSLDILVTNGNPYSADAVTVWVDWNSDGVFGVGTDEEFILVTNDGASTFEGVITAPTDLAVGDYRMRVRMTDSSVEDPAPCDAASWGEVEDYTLSRGVPWLSADVLSGSLMPGESQDINVGFNSNDRSIGMYLGSLNFSTNDPVNSNIVVPVDFEIVGATGILSGYVNDATSRGPVEGVTITADGIRESAITDEFGFYELVLLIGDYTVTASKDGYVTQTVQSVMIEEGITTTQDFMLDFAAPVLLYAEGGVGEIYLGWDANPQARGESQFASLSDKQENTEKMHGPAVKIPYSSGRAIGDDCTDPIVIGALPFTTMDSTCGRGNYTDTTCLGSYDGGEDIFYMLTLAEETPVSITMTTETTYTGMLLTDECPPSGDCIVTATNSGSGGNQIQQVLPAGTYYIMIDTWPSPDCIPEFTLTVEEYSPCVVECPVGSIQEPELCGEDLNGGCNADEFAVTPISNGDVICGTAWADDGRDTDWYELVITEPKSVTWSATAEFPVLIFIIDGSFGCGGLEIITSAVADPCEEAMVTAELVPGTYWLFVSDQNFEGNPCGDYNDYVAEVTCTDTFITYYNVFRDDEQIATTYYDFYTDMDIMPDTEYCYTVSQVIEEGLETGQSNELCASMLCEDGCDYTFNLTDSYGDGWNGAAITIVQNGDTLGAVSIASGYSASYLVALCDGADISLGWTEGSYDSECGFSLVGPAGDVLYSFEAGGAPLEGEFFTFTNECPVIPEQVIMLEQDWNAWSAYIATADEAGMEEVLAPVLDDMIITQYFSELYYPDYGIMTMADFTNQHGYFTKMEAAATLTLTGMMADPTVTIPEGWSLLPVLQDCSIPAADVLSNIAGLVIAWDPVGNGIYYPAGNLYTLVDLNPGMAYWVKVDAETTFTYPGCEKASGANSTSLRPVNNTNWNDVNFTPVNHAVIFGANATATLQQGDMIGAFTSNNWCAGMVEYTGANLGLNLFGDDLTTDMADGFAEGESLTFRLFRPATEEEFEIDVTYDYEAPNADGLFAINGISVITDMKLSPTSIGENMLNGLNIYPNPSSGVFNIAIGNLDEEINFVVLNAQGQEVYNGSLIDSQLLDLSAEPKGVYFIKFINESVLGIEKLVIK